MGSRILVADTEIRSDVRALLAQHRFDLQRVQFCVAGGTVRVSGELIYLGGFFTARVSGSVIDAFERDVSFIPGVRHVYLDLENWRRLASGEWQLVAERKALALPLAG